MHRNDDPSVKIKSGLMSSEVHSCSRFRLAAKKMLGHHRVILHYRISFLWSMLIHHQKSLQFGNKSEEACQYLFNLSFIIL